MGRTPPELAAEAEDGNVIVGLLDKRETEYEEQFRSFSGAGHSLRAAAAPSTNATFDPSALPETPPAVNEKAPVTSIQVRLPNGQRRVIRINLSSTVADLAAHLRTEGGSDSFRFVAGFPPKPLKDASVTVEAAGLKGAQVSMQKA
jgi:UBX domain-containing protein 1